MVTTGNAGDWTTSAGANAVDSEWFVLDLGVWTNLGSHTIGTSDILGCTDESADNYDA
jgi:hypothetical protein